MTTGSISSLGVGSGLQLQEIIDQLREVDEKVVTQKREQVVELETQLDQFTVVKNKLLSLKSAALDLSLSSSYLSRTVSSSDEKVLTASTSDGATVQSPVVTVNRIAAKSSWMTEGLSSSDGIVYVPTTHNSTTGVSNPAEDDFITQDGTLTIVHGSGASKRTINVTVTSGMSMNELISRINDDTADNQGGPGENDRYVTAETFTQGSTTFLRIRTDVANGSGEANRVAITAQAGGVVFEPPERSLAFSVGGTTFTLNVAADTTLAGLASLINSDSSNPGVTATVINDGHASTPYRLVLQSNETGENKRISMLAPLSDISFTEQNGAEGSSLNAQIAVDGINYQRQGNSINDILLGVTLNLKGTGSSTVAVGNNDDGLKTMIVDMVSAYNEVVQEIQKNVAYDEKEKKFGILARTTVRDVTYYLQNVMTSSVKADSGGNVTTLFDLGLQFNRDGTITIDESVLSTAISSHGSGIQAFFLGDSTRDLTGFADLINDRLRVLTGGSGQIEAEKSAAKGRISALNLEIEASTARLDKRYELLTKQFIELDRYMKQMTSIADFLTGQFTSLNNVLSGSGS